MSLAKQYLAREGAYSTFRVSYVELGVGATPKLQREKSLPLANRRLRSKTCSKARPMKSGSPCTAQTSIC